MFLTIGLAAVLCSAPGNGPNMKNRSCGESPHLVLPPLQESVSVSNDDAGLRSTKLPVTPFPASCALLRLKVSPTTGALLTGSSTASCTVPVVYPAGTPQTAFTTCPLLGMVGTGVIDIVMSANVGESSNRRTRSGLTKRCCDVSMQTCVLPLTIASLLIV